MERIDDIFNRSEIKQILHRDADVKEIGDRVLIIDFSSVTHLNGLPLDIDDPEMQFSSNYFIVIETRLKHRYDAMVKDVEVLNFNLKFPTDYLFGMVYTQDLIIVNPRSAVQYRVNSGHVMLKR